MDYNTIENESGNLDIFDKFGQFIDLSYFYHFKICRNNNCGNCSFIDQIIEIYIDTFTEGGEET